ncbi:UNVERIFIED_CONTAM: hypothetical protein Slati_4272300 [Sesamum latifolium]|uniref:Retrotransposon Copia-like N-terminal domain-containing protein n=1 Tax=Sesamum latifolium TaxID=2727402 RepID=A0AAW2TDA6_9LAMI
MAPDPKVLKVQPSDNPGMSLVSVPLDGNNFLSCSRSVRIALGAKMKLSFINEKGDKPEEIDESYEQWVRADCMVTSWILNLISKDIVESFMYTTTARELWVELETLFGQGNGPMVYQLKREISSIAQGAMNQILMQEPLPSVSKAYSMILRVEKQREVHSSFPNSGQNMAMQARRNIFRRSGNTTVFQKKKTAAERKTQLCEYCGKNGHTKEVCFEIHGYPDWYRNLVEQRRRDGASTSRTYNGTSNEEHAQNTLDEIGISEIVRNEIQRYMGDTESAVTGAEDYQEFSDGTKHPVKKTGEVALSPTLRLNDVLFVPDLKYNLLSDHKIKKVVGIGRLIGRLYVLDDMSFSEKAISQWLNSVNNYGLNVSSANIDIWHRSLVMLLQV